VDSTEQHFTDALEWSRFDVAPSEKRDANIVEATANGNLGAFYLAKNKIAPSKTYLEEALVYHKAGLDIRKIIFESDTSSPEAFASIGTSYHCIATDYYELGDYEKSLEYFQYAIDNREKGNSKEIRLVESYIRAIATLWGLIKAKGSNEDSKCHNHLAEIVLLLKKALQHPACLKRNRYELSKLLDYIEKISEIVDVPKYELGDDLKVSFRELSILVKQLEAGDYPSSPSLR
jgi:tetratricopeptide (TPR) repeat protein